MKVYLVRHGQTQEHANKMRQRPDSILSREGKRQARLVSKRISLEDIDLVLSSNLPRARETAEIIAKTVSKPLEVFLGIHEKEQHPALYGIDEKSEIHKEFEEDRLNNWDNLDWKFKRGGESLRDTIKRALKFKRHIEAGHLGQNLAIVSHGDFIRCFVALCALGEEFDEHSFARLCKGIHTSNTGVSLLEYKEEERYWSIRFLNEHAHLPR